MKKQHTPVLDEKAQAIVEFDVEDILVDHGQLIAAWMPAIESVARHHVSDDRFQAFMIAALRLGAASGGLRGVNVVNIVEKAGYSRATFFRMFEGHTSFMLKGYQLVCVLSLEVYRELLESREMSIEEFCRFTCNVFYGAICTWPNELIQMLWQEHGASQREFHPHLPQLAKIMESYLKVNPATAHLKVEIDDLEGVIQTLDWDILRAKTDPAEEFPTIKQYWRLRRILQGYLQTLA
ncbi:MAG: hypothetical protein NXH94_17795 [Rhodobacteraceae bacterium]|jgi:hypothetical protein|nr:hypothetical protein [Paracoccaceae bacterium]